MNFLRDMQKATAVTKQEMSLKSVVMDYLAFINSPRPHDSDSWNEVVRNPVYSSLHSLFEKVFSASATSAPVQRILATAVLLCDLIGHVWVTRCYHKKVAKNQQVHFLLHFLHSSGSQTYFFYYNMFKTFVHSNDCIHGDPWLCFPKNLTFPQNNCQTRRSLVNDDGSLSLMMSPTV